MSKEKDDEKKFNPRIIDGGKLHPKESKKKKQLTPKQEQFCKGIVFDKLSASESYRQAYSTDNMKPSSIWTESSKLLSNPMVTSRIESLKAQIEVQELSSSLSEREKIISHLWDMAEQEKVSDSTRVRSLELLGKTIGLFSDKVEITESKSQEELEKELKDKLITLSQTIKS